MIYFFSDPHIYSFENLYPLYLECRSRDIECYMDAEFIYQGENIPREAKSHRGLSNLEKINNGTLPEPKLIIINQCWWRRGAQILKQFSKQSIPVITTEHGSPMLYYGEGAYRGNLRGSVSHPTWGNVGRDIMVKLGCQSIQVPPLGSPRLDYYFSRKPKNKIKKNEAVIFGTKSEGTKPWNVDINNKVKIIQSKHNSVKFKGKILGPLKLLDLESIDKDFSSNEFYELFNSINHAYFWFPSSLITIAKIMGCKTYALYSDSHCKYTSNYFNEHKDHIFPYNIEGEINRDLDATFLSNNLTPNGIDNILNYILNEKSFNINN
jgi:hypothetical protein